MKKATHLLLLSILTNLFFSHTANAQQFTLATRPYGDTISGEYIYGNGPVSVTFNLENNNDSAYILSQVEMIFNFGFFTTGAFGKLWYSASSLAEPSEINEANGWQLITTGTPITIVEYNYYPLFQNLTFTIPPHTQYRFAVASSRGIRVDPYGDGGPGFDEFANNGITLKVGSATTSPSSQDTVGAKGFPQLVSDPPAFFAGRITLEPATTTPVTLLNLTANYNNKNANTINWQTSQELNSKKFTIQKAYSLPQFTNVATINAAGNSSTLKNYTYTDNNIAYKPTYYRLLQTDIDGKTAYSKTVMVNPYKNSFTIGNLYPSPAQNDITIEYNSPLAGNSTILINDMVGRLLVKKVVGAVKGFNKTCLQVSGLAKGNYIITLLNNGQNIMGEFVKE